MSMECFSTGQSAWHWYSLLGKYVLQSMFYKYVFASMFLSFSVLGFEGKKVNPQGMKTSQFSQLKKPPVTEDNMIFFFLIRRKVGSSQEC